MELNLGVTVPPSSFRAPCPSTRPMIGTLSSQQDGQHDLLFRVESGPEK